MGENHAEDIHKDDPQMEVQGSIDDMQLGHRRCARLY